MPFLEEINKTQLLNTCIDIIELNEKINEMHKPSTPTSPQHNLNIEVSLNFMIEIFYEFSFFKD